MSNIVFDEIDKVEAVSEKFLTPGLEGNLFCFLVHFFVVRNPSVPRYPNERDRDGSTSQYIQEGLNAPKEGMGRSGIVHVGEWKVGQRWLRRDLKWRTEGY